MTVPKFIRPCLVWLERRPDCTNFSEPLPMEDVTVTEKNIPPNHDTGGCWALIRPPRPDGQQELIRAFHQLSSESRARRFLVEKSELSPGEIERFLSCDGALNLALTLVPLRQIAPLTNSCRQFLRKASTDFHAVPPWLFDVFKETRPVGVANLFRSKSEHSFAEVAVVVADPWHCCGVGTRLIHQLARYSPALGISHWEASYYAENHAIKHLLQKVGEIENYQLAGAGVVAARFKLKTIKFA